MNCETIGTRSEADAGAVPPIPDMTGQTEQALLILDRSGDIQFCGAPGFFGYKGDETLSLSIRRLIPDLALRRSTPGYNLAYVNFWFEGGTWQRFEAVTPEGQRFAVELCLQVTRIQHKHWLLAHVRKAGARPVAALTQSAQTALTLLALAA